MSSRRVAGLMALAVSTLLISVALAQAPGMQQHMGPGMMNDQSGMQSRGCMMGCGMMMGMMTPKSVIPVNDGIVVVIGNRIVKYDKNLNLKKEVTVQVDMDELRNLMRKAMKSCPAAQPDQSETE